MNKDLLEKFTFLDQADKALEQLVPNTEDYYYYHCLDAMRREDNGKFEKLLKAWVESKGKTERVKQIALRHILSEFDGHFDDSVAALIEAYSISFHHQKEREGVEALYKTVIDETVFSDERLFKRALSRNYSLSGFKDEALNRLYDQELTVEQTRELLKRTQYPDHPRLVEAIVKELGDKKSGGFGSIEIHKKLTTEQLVKLMEEKPDLKNTSTFIETVIRRLWPSPDSPWKKDRSERRAYLNELWNFVRSLGTAFNSLKLHVLYHQLKLDLAVNKPNKERFIEYLKIPRSTTYMKSTYIHSDEHRYHHANVQQQYLNVTQLERVGDDTELVTDLLSHFLESAANTDEFAELIDAHFLKNTFAITKLLAGVGDPEVWAAMLNNNTAYQKLKDDVVIEFAPHNKKVFDAQEPVVLDLDIKNVNTLVIKVFEINALNYYLLKNRELNTDIELDGLVPSHEERHTYDSPAIVRKRRRFEFEELARPGVFVIDFIGNGLSSRALVRKGQLQLLERTGAAGHIFHVLDSANNILKDAELWAAGRKYKCDESGTFTVPYSTSPSRQTIIMRHGETTCRETFDHQEESYSWQVGFHCDKEQLLTRNKAEVLVRACLYLGETPTSLDLLKEACLTIVTTDQNDVQSTLEFRDSELQFSDENEALVEFQVPENVRTVQMNLRAQVRVISSRTDQDLTASDGISVNDIDDGQQLTKLYLSQTSDGYVAYLYGKTGEPRPNKLVRFEFQLREYTEKIYTTLKTDEAGRITLGALPGVIHVSATGPTNEKLVTDIRQDSFDYPEQINVQAGQGFAVPLMSRRLKAEQSGMALLEKRGQGYLRDLLSYVTVEAGYVKVKGLEAGDYDLVLKDQNVVIPISVCAGPLRARWLVGRQRHLQTQNLRYLQLKEWKDEGDKYQLHFGEAGKLTRVHIMATRFIPECDLDILPSEQAATDSVNTGQTLNQFVAGRDIGDEYRYILDRRYARKYPGCMLRRPGLLLNPWAMEDTSTAVDHGEGGTDFKASAKGASRDRRVGSAQGKKRASAGQFPKYYSFLKKPSKLLANLSLDENGVLAIDKSEIEGYHHIQVLAVDPRRGQLCRHWTMPESDAEFEDLRLILSFNADEDLTERQQVSLLAGQSSLRIADIATSQLERFDTLPRIFGFFKALNDDSRLTKFDFILDWPNFDQEKKSEKYSEYACHELNIFLWKKDPEFFKAVIQPYLKNKKEKTFIDDFLIGRDLTAYLRPQRFNRLNVFEKVLLSTRVSREKTVAAYLDDILENRTEDRTQLDHFFKTALTSSSLSGDDDLGMQAAQTKIKEQRVARKMAESSLSRLESPKMRKKAKRSQSAGPRSSMAPPPPPAPGGGGMAFGAVASAAPAPMRALADFDMMEEESDASFLELSDDEYYDDVISEKAMREDIAPLYQKTEKTKEYGENQYFERRYHEMNAELVPVNAFWRDYAHHAGGDNFLSQNIAHAHNDFTEMMLALAVLDIPFTTEKAEADFDGAQMDLKVHGPTIVFHKEIKVAERSEDKLPILVSQNYFRPDDRYRYVQGERLDKYVEDEFLTFTVYTCQVVLTNPSSATHKLDLLLQIPKGAVPVNKGFRTSGKSITLSSFATQTFSYSFYFPAPGDFSHYGVRVAKNEKIVASTTSPTLHVVTDPSKVDTESWAYVSQKGTIEQVIDFLKRRNLEDVDLSKIAWRMKEKSDYDQIIGALEHRHKYHETLWSYSLKHKDRKSIIEYLENHATIQNQCEHNFESSFISFDPVDFGKYQQLEYEPFINARAHRFGRGERKILNNRLASQYNRFLGKLKLQRGIYGEDRLAAAYYLFLQDRVEEAQQQLAKVNRQSLETVMQYDLMAAYSRFFGDSPLEARAFAEAYRDYPVARWRRHFQQVLSQLDELENPEVRIIDKKDRDQQTTKQAVLEESFDIRVEDRNITLTYQNIKACELRYYLMDIELLFSREPFVQQESDQFAFVRPNKVQTIDLDPSQVKHKLELPEDFHGSNLVVEALAAGRRQSQAYYANAIHLQLSEQYGQLRVLHDAEQGRPLPKTYIKVYAKMNNGRVRFYKDGYSDHRGRFDYSSLSTDELDSVKRFAILVMHSQHGSVIKEAPPPSR